MISLNFDKGIKIHLVFFMAISGNEQVLNTCCINWQASNTKKARERVQYFSIPPFNANSCGKLSCEILF